MNLDLREIQNMPYFLTGSIPYEGAEELFIRSVVMPGEVCVDIGANIGWYSTILAEAVGPEGKVYGFEPQHAVYELLSRTASRYKQLIATNLALSDHEGEAELHIPSHLGNASLRDLPGSLERQRCYVARLDEYLRTEGNPRISFVKCDVEGAEIEVLRGAIHLLSAENPPILMIEINPGAASRFGYHPDDFVKLLDSHGYVGYLIDSKSGVLEPLPSTFTSIFNAIFVPECAVDRVSAYQENLCAKLAATPLHDSI